MFLKVAETGSFAAAARLLGISQPAVSQSISKLEEIYGADLFTRRRGMPVSLTQIGRAILPKAKLVLFLVDAQIRRATTIAQSLAGTLTIGFTCHLGHGILGSGLADFRAEHPDIDMRFVESSASDLYRQLNERLIDIMFAPFLPDLSSSSSEQEGLWEEPLFAVLPLDHPMASKESMQWEDISALTILLQAHEGDMSPYRALAAHMANRHFDSSMHDVSSASLLDMVYMGLGATIVCASTANIRDDLAFRPIADNEAKCSIEALWRRDDRNPLRHRLLAFMRSHAVGR
ncbi:hypothetical protein A0J57_11650 [Sphingobium sp. 22B]|nr:hypothetical protein A0J57_11650 [Sphingobium sp. 22B]OAP31921.1 hypothetical protein A8O16_11445 [Sphingobium sp. 20006FA]